MFIKTLRTCVVIALISIFQYYPAFAVESVDGEGKWNKPGIPHKGWTHVIVEDLEDIIGVCDMCDKTGIRYLHTVSHDDYENLTVGCSCAEKNVRGLRKSKTERSPIQKSNSSKRS